MEFPRAVVLFLVPGTKTGPPAPHRDRHFHSGEPSSSKCAHSQDPPLTECAQRRRRKFRNTCLCHELCAGLFLSQGVKRTRCFLLWVLTCEHEHLL